MLPFFCRFATASLIFLGFSCSNTTLPTVEYRIGIDPSWTTLNMPGRSDAFRGFTVELLEKIAKRGNFSLAVYDLSWDVLFASLEERSYDAIAASLTPQIFYEKIYQFSTPYLSMGPVLVVGETAPFSLLSEMSGKEVGYVVGSEDWETLAPYPEIIQKTYPSTRVLLEAVASTDIDGAIVDRLIAIPYCKNLYQNVIKVGETLPSKKGLRLVSLVNKSSFIERFDKILAELQADGSYAALTQKWGLAQ